jgi:PIN domain nuclease of toxin-antitoxin system
MKNQYALEVLLEKVERISDNWSDRILPVLPEQIHSIVNIAEKMTKEELNREKEARKQRALKKHQDYLQTISNTDF